MSEIKVELQDWMGSDVAIANAAWTSTYDKDRREGKYDDPVVVKDLIQKMAKEGHSVPFESVVFRFWIRAPIFVDRQHMTHRIASHNGLSGRYRTLPEDWYELPPDIIEIFKTMGLQDNLCGVGLNFVGQMVHQYNSIMDRANIFYRDVLAACKRAEKAHVISNGQYKRVREVARGVIGTSSMTERTTVMNLPSFANYQRLRNSDHAQPEIRGVAQMMLDLVWAKKICPAALDALVSVGWRI